MARRTGLVLAFTVAGALMLGVLASIGAAGLGSSKAKTERMSGYFEVPSVSSPAQGRFEATIKGSSIEYKLTFSGLEGTVTQAHIHFAQQSVNGGISAWLCETAGTQGPGLFDTQCPASGTVRGTIVAADVQNTGPAAAQGIAAGEFTEFVDAIRAGFTYANVHSSKFPTGEIRAQIKGGGGDDDDD